MSKQTSRAVRLALLSLCTWLVVGLVSRPALAGGGDACGTLPPALAGSDTGTTVGQADDVGSVPLTCNGIYQQVAGRDVFYRLVVGATNNFTVTVTPAAGYDTSIYILSACGNGSTCNAGKGADNGLAGEAEGLTVSGLAAGIYYLGIDSFYPTSNAQSAGAFTVSTTGSLGTVATTTSLTAAPSPSVFGEAVTLTATVSSAIGAPGSIGSVAFKIDGNTLGSVPVDASGKATYTTNTSTVGNHSFSAVYTSATAFQTSTGTTTHTVGRASTTTTVASSANPSTASNAVTFTAHVGALAPGAGAPSGQVTFNVDGADQPATTLSAGGDATLTTSSLSKGTHTIKATYAGDTNFVGSASSNLSQGVTGIVTTTTVTSTANPSVHGQSVTFTATVQGASGGVPTGALVFSVDNVPNAPVALDGTGKATFTTTTLATGARSISAAYGADTLREASTGSISQTVNKAATTSTLTATPNPAVYKQNVTLKTTVVATAPGTGIPGGSVTFFDGATQLGRATLDAAGAASLTASFGVGSHALTATYEGNTDYATSTTATVTETVNQAASSVALSTSASPSIVTQAVTFTAAVSVTAPGDGTATGTVTFSEGATVLGTGTLDATGRATYATSTLAVGSHAITAVYGGDANVTASTSTALTQVVRTSGAAVAVTSSENPSVKGTNVTFTAAITAVGSSATPTGTVTFSEGATTLGTGTIAGGNATFATSALAGGAHTIRATYEGDTNFDGGEYGTIVQQVDPAATTTTITGSPNPSFAGDAVTFVAKVTSTAGTPTGQVKFVDEDSQLGTVDLAGDSASFVTSALTVGTHQVHAEYVGNDDFATSQSAAVAQVVKPAANPDGGAPDGGTGNDGGVDAGGPNGGDTDGGNHGSDQDGGDGTLPTNVDGSGDGGGGGCSTTGHPATNASLLGLVGALGVLVAGARRRTARRVERPQA